MTGNAAQKVALREWVLPEGYGIWSLADLRTKNRLRRYGHLPLPVSEWEVLVLVHETLPGFFAAVASRVYRDVRSVHPHSALHVTVWREGQEP